jgi:hypothetical protein
MYAGRTAWLYCSHFAPYVLQTMYKFDHNIKLDKAKVILLHLFSKQRNKKYDGQHAVPANKNVIFQ